MNTSNQDNLKSIKTVHQELLIHYLFKGTLPANAITKNLETLIANVHIDNDFKTAFLNRLDQEHDVLHMGVLRLVYNLPESLHKAIINALGEWDNFQSIKTLVNNTSIQYVLLGQLIYWITLLRKKASLPIPENDGSALLAVAHQYFGLNTSDVLAAIAAWELDIAQANAMQESIKLFFRSLTVLKQQIGTAHDFIDLPEEQASRNDIDAILEAIQGSNNQEKNNANQMHYYIANAGLVILQPYFSKLFHELGFLDGLHWKQPYFQHRAVLLTQYLIWGNIKIFESDFLLNKLLCGVPITETVSTDWDISESEAKECQKLLESVILHWKVLKNTSIDGLRATFLQREAKLIGRKGSRYELIVARKGVDILLDQLPWGIGILKTPWMRDYLSCQWT